MSSLTVPELRAQAKAQGLSGYSRLKKAELIQLLNLPSLPFEKKVEKVRDGTEDFKAGSHKVQCGKLIRTKPWPSIAGYKRINVCSSTKGVWLEFSPMKLGPVTAFSITAKRFENLWQFAKVYQDEVDEKGDPTALFFERQTAGNLLEKGMRRKQKGNCLYCWWNGRKLSYLEARHQVYVPFYVKEVQKTQAWRELLKLYQSNDILIVGYDGREYTDLEKEYWDDKIPFGHELVLCAMLEGKIDLETGMWI